MTSTNSKASGKKVQPKKTVTSIISKAAKEAGSLIFSPKLIEIENRYKVPVKLWKGFGRNGQQVFNGTMDQTIKNQEFINDPKAPKIPEEQWKCICWNIACSAAWEAKKI